LIDLLIEIISILQYLPLNSNFRHRKNLTCIRTIQEKKNSTPMFNS